ncbi:MAG: LysR substrate-binding domain-containing protein [Planktotalea sp.]|uniref:LysR substrate-binding domain-containing protein n=1 Tax=Planktotalea sp. TaxID=2029877 RepID=UPI003C72B96D
MSELRNTLPPLNYLIAFEAAARLGGFAHAAKQLHISESSISRKIRLLEEHFGVPLFVRGHRSVKLTQLGASYYTSVSQSLTDLRNASEELLKKDGADTVRVAATNSVSALWLMPRLRAFHENHSEIRIRLTASDSDAECLGSQMDMSILRGDGNWDGYETTLLFGETVFPVCSPAYLARMSGAVSLDRISQLDLIEVSSDHPEWMNWANWLVKKGVSRVDVEQTAIFNTYPLAIHAAVDGLGIALGWGHLVDYFLRDGRLVRPFGEAEVRTNAGYYLLRKTGQETQTSPEVVVQWLLGESASRERYGVS